MAKETRSVDVLPTSEAYTIEEWEGFGWEVLSSQRTKNNSGVSIVKLTFTRDKEMKNYAELRQKFELYLEKEEEMKAIDKKQRNLPRPVIAKFNVIVALLGLITGIGFIIYVVSYVVSKKRAEKELVVYNEEYAALQSRFNQLDNECEELLNEAKALVG